MKVPRVSQAVIKAKIYQEHHTGSGAEDIQTTTTATTAQRVSVEGMQ